MVPPVTVCTLCTVCTVCTHGMMSQKQHLQMPKETHVFCGPVQTIFCHICPQRMSHSSCMIRLKTRLAFTSCIILPFLRVQDTLSSSDTPSINQGACRHPHSKPAASRQLSAGLLMALRTSVRRLKNSMTLGSEHLASTEEHPKRMKKRMYVAINTIVEVGAVTKDD